MVRLRDELKKGIGAKFPGDDERKSIRSVEVLAEELERRGAPGEVIGRFLKAAEVLAEELERRGAPGEVIGRFLKAAPNLFDIGLTEEDLKSIVRIIVDLYKDDRFANFLEPISIEAIGRMLKSRDEPFVREFFEAGLLLKEKSPLAFLMYLSDNVIENVIKNQFSQKGIRIWIDKLLQLTNDGKDTTLLLDYLSFRDDLYANFDLSECRMRTSVVFYENVARMLEALISQHYNMKLYVEKSLRENAYAVEGDEIHIFLPSYVDIMDNEEKNELFYCILADHEAGHIYYGAFRAVLPAFIDYIQKELKKDIVVKKLEFADSTGMKLKSITYEYNGKLYFANSLLGFVSMLGDEYAEILKDLWNCIEDGKNDAWWLDEKAYGIKNVYLEMEYTQVKATERGGLLFDYSVTGMRNLILLFVRGYAGATHRDKFVKAVFSGETEGLNEEEKKIVELIRSCDSRALTFLEKHSKEIIETIMNRVYHTTPVVLLAFKIVNEWKNMVEKGEIKKPEEKDAKDRVGGTGVIQLDPENISFEVGDEQTNIPLDELPEDLQKKFKDKLKKFLDGLDDNSRKELENRVKKGGNKKDNNKADDQGTFNRDLFVLEYNPEDGSSNLRVPIHVREALNCESMADPEVVGRLSILFRKIAQLREHMRYGDQGEEIDPFRLYEYYYDVVAGNRREPDYYIIREITRIRNVAIEIVVDASGSTSAILNGRRVIDYLVGATHTTVEALSRIPGIKVGYSFYQSYGPVNGTTIYIGKDIDEPNLTYRKVEPSGANRDGAARRAAIERLAKRKEPVKILIFVCDSLPADDDYAHCVDDVRQARIEGERNGIIQFTITTPVDESHLAMVPQCKTPEDYFSYMYGENNWYVISSEKDLIEAYSLFFILVLKKLRVTESR
ncbi:MAG: hypothetical protein QXZ28_04285 [Candidatus Methanomethylicaceae archaeon]